MSELRAKVATVLSTMEVAINVGSEAGVSEGDEVRVWSTIDVTDPQTGAPLGSVRVSKLEMQVRDVHPLFSVARVGGSSAFANTMLSSLNTKVVTNGRTSDDKRVVLSPGDEISVYILDTA